MHESHSNKVEISQALQWAVINQYKTLYACESNRTDCGSFPRLIFIRKTSSLAPMEPMNGDGGK